MTRSVPYGRWTALGVCLIGLAMLAGNHYKAVVEGEVYGSLVVLGVCAVAMGLSGIIDPRLLWMWSVDYAGGPIPKWKRRISVALIIVAVALGFVLDNYVYSDFG